MSTGETLTRLRYRFLPDHMVGEILSKRWADNAIPFVALILVVAVFGILRPSMFSAYGMFDLTGQVAEFGLMAIALTVVAISGGIDLSIGSIFVLSVLAALTCLNVLALPMWVAVLAALGVGALCGAVNGFLIGVLRLRAFLTTLVTLVTFRSIYEMILPGVATRIVLGLPDSPAWDALSTGSVLGLPISILVAAVIALIWHVVLSRTRLGWHFAAVGGARRSAYNAGIGVRRVLFSSYVMSGMLTAGAGVLYGARLGSVGLDTGVGLEITTLTAVVLGGTSLGGGRGSVAKALLGSVIVTILSNGLMQLGLIGTVSSMILGIVLLTAVFLDVRWVKNRQKLINASYVSPAFLRLPDAPSYDQGSGTAYQVNDRLRDVEVIGLGEVEGPEDVLLDREGNLYSGTRHGQVMRFFAPDFKRSEVYAHIGGQTLGMNFDREGNLVVCVAGMGLYKVTPAREVVKLTDETNRTPLSIIDDSRLRVADDMDFAPDGRIFFSEATIRYNAHDWVLDSVEGRGNGRLICYDPRDKSTRTVLRKRVFPNGIVCLPDGQSLLFAETWACKISRYWFDGPKKGRVEVVVSDLPGYPDNINRASDGNFWVCLIGMRSPALDLANLMPGFRRRMTRRLSAANWLLSNINTGCVVKITPEGKVLESAWDMGGVNHPMVTSVKEHKGYLYIGGVSNNRIGRWKIPGADPNWTGPDSYWGPKA